MNAHDIIEFLGLEPLDREGGWFTETYRSDENLPAPVLPARYGGDRQLSTAIYYLVTPDSFSLMHRIISDEIFHFYCGDPVDMLMLFPDGGGRSVVLGPDLFDGQMPQCAVPRDTWQGLRLAEGGRYALLGTTVAPAFCRDDFELGDRDGLVSLYPAYADAVTRLTHPE